MKSIRSIVLGCAVLLFTYQSVLAQQVVMIPASAVLSQSNSGGGITSSLGGSFSGFANSTEGSIATSLFSLGQESGPVDLLVMLQSKPGTLNRVLATGEPVHVLNLSGRRLATLPLGLELAQLEMELTRMQTPILILQSGSGERSVRMIFTPRR